MSDAAFKRVQELILAAAPAYETYLLQVMGKPFYLKMPLFKTTPERFRVTFESVEQPALGTKKPERLIMWVELNRSMGTSTVSCEYWQNIDDAEPTARSEAQVDVTPENLMAPAFALGWLHKLVGGGNEGLEGDEDMSSIEEERMEHAELLIVKADALLAELGYTIEAESYESYANTLDNFLLTAQLDEQVEGILKKIGNVVRKAAHAYGAVKGGVAGASARWKGFKASVKSAYSKGHAKGYKAATGKGDDDDEAPSAHEPKASGGKAKLKLVKGGAGGAGGRRGGKMSDKEYKARYGHPRKTIAASMETPTNDLEEMMDGLRASYFEAEFDSLGVEELLALEELVELMHEGNLDEKAKLGSGGRFASLVKKLKMREGAIRDPAALAAWIGRKKYGKEKFQKMAAAGRKEALEQGGVHGNWGGAPSSEAAVSSYQRLSGLVTPMQGWSLPKLK